MQKKTSLIILEKLRELIFSDALMLKFRMKEQDFTRNRKQPFVATLLLMLNMLRKTLAIEIDNFLSHFKDGISLKNAKTLSTSAFVQNKRKINPAVFKYLSSVVRDNFYAEENTNVKVFMGFRVLAVDGSWITLPCTSKLKAHYGATKNQSGIEVVQARLSVLYDVQNKLVLDAGLSGLKTGERELALGHAGHWQKDDLIIYDRGYPGYDFILEHIKRGVDYLVRVKVNEGNVVKEFVNSGKQSITTKLFPPQNHSFKDKEYTKDSGLKIRLIRVGLPSGEIEILVTSLLDSQKYPSKIFKQLYFMRWGIEGFYDELKNKLKVEHFTGYSLQSIEQDVLCAIFISNVQSIIVNDLQEELKEQNKTRLYQYKVNTNLSYGFLKNRILELLFKKASLEQVFKELEQLFLAHTVPIRNNRTNPRVMNKYRARVKPKVTKNQKDAI